jgi:CRP/FNR family nitrogen fixation transcriptional regulator
MFVRITTDPAPRPTSLCELGIATDTNPKVSLNEFTYKKGAEIYGEKEPANYVYQVKIGAVRSYGGGDREHHGSPNQAAQSRDGS